MTSSILKSVRPHAFLPKETMTLEDIDNRFDYHKPDTLKVGQHETIREQCRHLAYSFESLIPAGREKSLAITKLEEAMFWANAGIARHTE